jgi:hypothetical protein
MVYLSSQKVFLILLTIVFIFSGHATVYSTAKQSNKIIAHVFEWEGGRFVHDNEAFTSKEALALAAKFKKYFSNDLAAVHFERMSSDIAILPVEGIKPSIVLFDEAANSYKTVPAAWVDSRGYHRFSVSGQAAPVRLIVSNGVLKNAQATPPSLAPRNSDPKELPQDFAFKLNFGVGGINCMDTYKSTFTKDLVDSKNGKPSTAARAFVIPPEQMLAIYGEFLSLKIADLPSNLNTGWENETELIGVSPSQRITLTYTCNGVTRTIVFDEGEPWPDTTKPNNDDRLRAFVGYISNYVSSTKEYANMPPAVGVYL